MPQSGSGRQDRCQVSLFCLYLQGKPNRIADFPHPESILLSDNAFPDVRKIIENQGTYGIAYVHFMFFRLALNPMFIYAFPQLAALLNDKVRQLPCDHFNLPPVNTKPIYGNSPKLLVRTALVGLCLGCLASSASMYALWLGGRTSSWVFAVLVLLGVPFVMLLVVLPCVLFHIRLHGGAIQRVFMRKRVIDEYPLEDFLDLHCHEVGLLAFLRFRNGNKIPVLGVGWGELNRLSCDLHKARGNAGAVVQ